MALPPRWEEECTACSASRKESSMCRMCLLTLSSVEHASPHLRSQRDVRCRSRVVSRASHRRLRSLAITFLAAVPDGWTRTSRAACDPHRDGFHYVNAGGEGSGAAGGVEPRSRARTAPVPAFPLVRE